MYACGTEVLCWAFNVRDSAATSLVEGTRSAVFVGEALSEDQADRLLAAISELRATLESAGLAAGFVATADASTSQCAIPEP